jgi:hypothetical protein
MEKPTEASLWALFFASLVGWRFHPGYDRASSGRPNVVDCAALADFMLLEYRSRYGGLDSSRSGSSWGFAESAGSEIDERDEYAGDVAE